jgi:DNA-binding NtrC family response regulator
MDSPTLDFVAEAPCWKPIRKRISKVAPTRATVLITGESGTGKELVAQAIHNNSEKRDKPFIVINCAAIPETLVESLLFGHEKGSFTGAMVSRDGIFQQADGGTLFLDEIGEMPIAMQTRLLRAVEQLTIRRIGHSQDTKVDVRILAATNRDPVKAIKEEKLRPDLYHRLSSFRIDIPPLRERREDVIPLIEHFVGTVGERSDINRKVEFSKEGVPRLYEYAWPGNVRELSNAVQTAFIISENGHLSATEIMAEVEKAPYSNDLNQALSIPGFSPEEQKIIRTLIKCRANMTEAAMLLGIRYDKFKKLVRDIASRIN